MSWQNLADKATKWYIVLLELFGLFTATQAFLWTQYETLGKEGSQQTWFISALISLSVTSTVYFLFSQVKLRHYKYPICGLQMRRFKVPNCVFLDSLPIPVVIVLPTRTDRTTNQDHFVDNRVLFVNQAWVRHYHWRKKSAIGKKIMSLRTKKSEIIVPPPNEERNAFLKKLFTDWNECFVKINEGADIVRSNIDIPMKMRSGEVKPFRFFYIPIIINNKVRATMVLTDCARSD